MLESEKNEIIRLFKTNMSSYLALSDLQEAISSVTFLFWNAKFVAKKPFESYKGTYKVDGYLQEYSDIENQTLVYDINNAFLPCFAQLNLNNILDYLNNLTEEKLIEIVCEDYNSISRFNNSTPDSINELAYKILEQIEGTKVLDICSYRGNYLTNYAKNNSNYIYNGIEINYKDNLIAKMRLQALNVKYELYPDNVFYHHFEEFYDKVFCNPPFMGKMDLRDIDSLNHDKKIGLVLSKYNTSDWAFVKKTLESMSSKGKAIFVMLSAPLYKQPDIEVRKYLIENGFVEGVISLPANLLSNTAVPVNILVLSNKNKEVRFVNAENFVIDSKSRYIKSIDVDKVFKEYTSDRDTKYAKTLLVDKIRDNDYSLLVTNYVGYEEIVVNNAKKLSEVVIDVFRGHQVMAAELDQYSTPNNKPSYKIVNINNINNGEIDKNLVEIYPDNDKYDKWTIQDGDLLVSAKGTLSKFAVAKIKDEKIIPNGNLLVIRVDKEKINPYYLKMFLESKKGEATINSIKSGGVLPSINYTQLKNINVPVPSIEEQNKVVENYLVKNDEIRLFKLKLQKSEDSLNSFINENF